MSVVIETTVGTFTVDLFHKECSRACLNFIKLCKLKYYNFSLFHTVQNNFIAQTGDPTGSGNGGESLFGHLYGEQARFFEAELPVGLKHKKVGTVSLVNCGDSKFGSQFFVTLAENLDSLDGEHCIIGEVAEGFDTLTKLNEAICDKENRPYQDIRITHTVILDDPFPDPDGLVAPDQSPLPTKEILESGRIRADEDIDDFAGRSQEEIEEYIKDKEAKAQATILEMIGDLPSADVAPPENVLFVCKLNPVTTDDDLAIIFGRFGNIKSCEVIRDRVSGKSLQYAFVEYDNPKAAENAYFKMDNVLIDDRRIHVDFSQSVSHLKWKGKGRGGYSDNFDPEKYERKLRKSSERDEKPRRSEDRRRSASREDVKSRRSEDRDKKKSRERDDRTASPDLTIKKPSKKSLRKRSDSRENGKSPSRSPQKRRRNSPERGRSPSYRRRSPPRRSPRGWQPRQDRFWNGRQRGRSPAYSRNNRRDDYGRRGGWRSSPRRDQRPPRYWDDRAFERDERYLDREARNHYEERQRRDRRSSERDYDRKHRDDERRRGRESRDRRRKSDERSKSRSGSPDKRKDKKKARKHSESPDRSRKRSRSSSESRGRSESRSRSADKEKASPPPAAPAPIVEMSYDKFGFLVRKVISQDGSKDDADSKKSPRDRKRSTSRSRRRRSRSRSRRRSPEPEKKSLEPNIDRRRRRGSTPEGRRRRSPSEEKPRRRSPSHSRSKRRSPARKSTPSPKKRSPTPEPKKSREESVQEKRKKAKSESESGDESSDGETKRKKRKKTKAKKKKTKKETSSSESSEESESESGASSDSGSSDEDGKKKKKKSKKKKHKK